MFKKSLFLLFISIFTTIFISCENSRTSGGGDFTQINPCNTEESENPVYDNDYFYLFSDSSKISDDSSVYYANGLKFDGGFSGTAKSKTSYNCLVDGSEALLIMRGTEKWSAGGWIGLADQPLDISNATNLVFYARAVPGQINGSFNVKIESINGAYEVETGFDSNDADGAWKKIEIPLSKFSKNGVDLTEVKSPFIFVMNEMDADDVIYIDCIYFDGAVKSPGKISLDLQGYNISATKAEISIIDPGSAGKTIEIIVENATDKITIENVTIDENGHGEAILNFDKTTDDKTNTLAIVIGETFNVTYLDSTETLRSDQAIIVPEGTLEGDINFDGKVYIYSSSEEVDLMRNIDYKTHHWDTFSTFDFNYTKDSDFSPVIEVQSGTGWGGNPVCIAFHSFEVSFSNYKNLNFKFKSENFEDITIKLPGSTIVDEQIFYYIKNYEITNGTVGWYKVTIPLSDFEDVSESDTVGIFHNGEEGTFYLTDIYFD